MMRGWMRMAAAWWGCAFVGAAAQAAEHGEKEVSVFEGDLGNLIWTLVIFVGVLMVLGRFAWGPVLKGLQKREKFIRDSLADAKQEREEAKRLLSDYGAKLDQARKEATAIVEEGRRDAEEVRKRVVAESRAEAEAMIKRAKKEITLARDDAVKQLHDQTVILATSVAEKMIHRGLGEMDHRELIDEALSEMGRLG